jgi:hypothetical protein
MDTHLRMTHAMKTTMKKKKAEIPWETQVED